MGDFANKWNSLCLAFGAAAGGGSKLFFQNEMFKVIISNPTVWRE
jgi:hypothetical protein